MDFPPLFFFFLSFLGLAAVAHADPRQSKFNALAATPTLASGSAAVDADGVESASLFTSYIMSGSVTPSETATLSAKKARDLQRRAPSPSERSSVFTTPLASSSRGHHITLLCLPPQPPTQGSPTQCTLVFQPVGLQRLRSSRPEQGSERQHVVLPYVQPCVL